MAVLVVTSPNERCGIREHSEMLQAAVSAVVPFLVDLRHGTEVFSSSKPWAYNIVHLDHHAALHAAWTPAETDRLRASGTKVVVTQHDTYETLDIMKERGFHDFHDHVDALIVHEPVEGLTDQGYDNVYYWRQPIPELPLDTPDWPEPAGYLRPLNDPPIVGSVGFNFPWKGFEELKKAADGAGWKTRIFGGSEKWLTRDMLLKELRRCDATAFLYSTGNSGTSAAIRMGIAARRPVIAFQECRQFRDLIQDAPVMLWTDDAMRELVNLELSEELRRRATATIQNLAAMDSWTNAGRRYAALYRRLSR